jgi:hypothetical protein
LEGFGKCCEVVVDVAVVDADEGAAVVMDDFDGPFDCGKSESSFEVFGDLTGLVAAFDPNPNVFLNFDSLPSLASEAVVDVGAVDPDFAPDAIPDVPAGGGSRTTRLDSDLSESLFPDDTPEELLLEDADVDFGRITAL